MPGTPWFVPGTNQGVPGSCASTFDGHHAAQDAGAAGPAVDVAVIVADLDAGAVDGRHLVQQPVAAQADEDDLVFFDGGGIAGRDRDEIAVEDPRLHRMPAGPDPHRLAGAKAVDGLRNPTHEKPPLKK